LFHTSNRHQQSVMNHCQNYPVCSIIQPIRDLRYRKTRVFKYVAQIRALISYRFTKALTQIVKLRNYFLS